MKCLKCGYEFSEGLFCPECGTKYDEEEAKRIEAQRIKEEQEEREREKEKEKAYQAQIEKEKIEQELELVKQKNENIRLQREEEERNRLLEEKRREEYNTIEEADTARKEFEESEKEKEEKNKKYTDLSTGSLVLSILSLPLVCTVILWIPASIISIVMGIKALKVHTQYKVRVLIAFILDSIALILGLICVLSVLVGIISPELAKYVEATETTQEIQTDIDEQNDNIEAQDENKEEINSIENVEDAEDALNNIDLDAFKAYYDYLEQNDNLNIFDYDHSEKSISFVDCYGDDHTEMLFSYPQNMGEYDVNMIGIATYDGSQIKKINSDIGFAPGAAGSPSIRLFVGENKKIYGIDQYSIVSDYCFEFFILEEGSDGVLHRNDIYSYIESEDYDTGNIIKEYKKGNSPMSQEDVAKEISELLKDPKKIYQIGYFYDMGDPYNIDSIITDDSSMMTYEEALTYLEGMLPLSEDSTASTNTELIQEYELIYEPVILEYKDAYEFCQNGYFIDEDNWEYLSNGFMDLAYTPKEEIGYLIEDISGDGIPELLIGDNYTEGEGYSFIWGGYTYKDGKIVRFLDGWWRNRYFWIENGEFYNAGNSGWSENCIIHLSINEDATSLMIDDYYFCTENSYGEISYYHNSLKNGAVKESEGSELGDISNAESISEEAFYNVTSKYIFEKLTFNPLF